jgi:hypothetical protein
MPWADFWQLQESKPWHCSRCCLQLISSLLLSPAELPVDDSAILASATGTIRADDVIPCGYGVVRVTAQTGNVLVQSANQESLVAQKGIFERRKARRLMLSLAASLYLICCLALALTRGPWYDEGFLANPSYAWITTGHPGISILDDSGPFLPFNQRMSMRGIREHIYAQMPLYVVFLAGWFKVVGFGLVRTRMFTILCGLVALLSWYSVVRKLTMDAGVAVVTFSLIAIDYGYVLRSSEGRMDALSAAFGFGALAVYLALRERNFARAVLLSHTCVAASAFTHPNGGMLAFAGLALLTLYYDRARIRPRHFAIALSPYLVASAGWGIYIAQDVQAFKAQFRLNSIQGGRLETFRSPWNTVKREILERYLDSLGGVGNWSGFKKLKVVIPLSYWAGLAGVLCIGELRRRKGYLALLLLTVTYFFVLAFTDGRKSQCYVVHIIPLFAALLAASIVWLWRKGKVYRPAVAAGVVLLCLIHVGGIFYQARADSYHKSYLPAIRFLKENTRADQAVIGPGVLGFGLRYPPNLTDDFRLGYLSGQRPDWVVVNDWYEGWFRSLKKVEPDAYQFVRTRLDNEFVPVYNEAGIVIYRRR